MIRHMFNQPVHVSWMVAVACLGVTLGVVVSKELPVFAALGWLLTGVMLVATAMLRGKMWLLIFAAAGGLLIGAWRGSDIQEQLIVFHKFTGSSVIVTGTLSDDIEMNQRQQTVLRLRSVALNGRPVPGQVWLALYTDAGLRRSDVVTVEGVLSEGFGGFAASLDDAKLRRLERAEPGDVALQVRNWFASGVERALEDTEASLGLGYLVGQRRGLPEELDAALVAAGLTHIVVASGYNLTILVRLARRIFEKTSKYLSFLSASAMIVSFVAITGLSPSMSRAGLVAGLSLMAWYYGRRFHPLVLLPLAMAVTVLVQPIYAWGDLGWQLSFLAFAGVMIFAPLCQAYFFGDKPERTLQRIFIETISAMLFTLPVLLVAFGQYSAISPIANMAILPFVPLAMVLTFFAGIGGLVIPAAAQLVGFPAQVVLSYMTQTTMMLGNLPWAMQEARVSVAGAAGMYVLLTCAIIWMQRATKHKLGSVNIVE